MLLQLLPNLVKGALGILLYVMVPLQLTWSGKTERSFHANSFTWQQIVILLVLASGQDNTANAFFDKIGVFFELYFRHCVIVF